MVLFVHQSRLSENNVGLAAIVFYCVCEAFTVNLKGSVVLLRRILALILLFSLLALPVSADKNEKYLALTFDDGPSGRFTRRLLDGLKERDAQATFLLCGYRIQNYPAEAQRIWDEGHEIAIHGYSHNSMCAMTCREIEKEIEKTAALLPEGCAPRFLRPPGGLCSQAVYQAAKNTGLGVLTWSVDPKDWATHDTAAIVKRVVSQAEDGDVILLHDMSNSSVDAALEIVDVLTRRGFRFVTASRLAQIKGVSTEPGKVYTRFP